MPQGLDSATLTIRRRFRLKNALDYLVSEKLLNFAEAAEQHPEFAAELPRFQAAVWEVFHLCYAKILSGPDFVSFSRDRDKGLSKRQSRCETQSRCSRCRSGLGLRFLSLLVLLTTVFGF